ncbi:hypothetical protein KKF32_03205, partial [Patescibacteria group bacterium]|nr:hypothetical protein [Patescibacteria group bacterium]
IIFLLIIFVGYFFILQSQLIKVYQNKVTLLAGKLKQLDDMEKYSLSLQKLEEAAKKFEQKQEKNIERFSQFLPAERNLANLIAQLETVMRVSGFNINSLAITESLTAKKTEQPPLPDDYEDIPNDDYESYGYEEDQFLDVVATPSLHVLSINLAIQGGDYVSFKNLLANLEKHIRLFDVSSINFSSPGDEGSYSLSITTYYYPEEI